MLPGFALPALPETSQPTTGIRFAISGQMPGDMIRADAAKILEKRGHTYVASVTKRTDYLIWDGATAGRKLAQALRCRTTILDAAQYPALLDWTELPSVTDPDLLSRAWRLMETDNAGRRQLRIDDFLPPQPATAKVAPRNETLKSTA